MSLNTIKKKYLNWVLNTSPLSSYCICFLILLACIFFEFRLNAHSFPVILSLMFAGWLVWGFTEYMTHRFIFHLNSRNKYLVFARYIMHGVHHHEPARTLFVPALLRISVLTLVFVTLWWLLGEYVFLFFTGLEIGVIQYITIHYALHHQKYSRYFPRLARYHYIHHFLEPDSVFGTSTLVWDRIFGTLPSKSYAESEYTASKHFIQS